MHKSILFTPCKAGNFCLFKLLADRGLCVKTSAAVCTIPKNIRELHQRRVENISASSTTPPKIFVSQNGCLPTCKVKKELSSLRRFLFVYLVLYLRDDDCLLILIYKKFPNPFYISQKLKHT